MMFNLKSLLLAVALVCGVAAADGTHVRQPEIFPPLPDSIPAVGGWTPVRRPEVIHCGQDTTKTFWGCYNANGRILEVRAGLLPHQAWHVLEHEKVHMIFRDAGVRFEDMEQEQRIANLVADNRVLSRIAGQ
jgi:hypothetical protein